MGYLDPALSGGTTGFTSFKTGTFTAINQSIDSLANWLASHEWIHHTDDGTLATTTLVTTAIPFHSGPLGGFSQVPTNAASMGIYGASLLGANIYVLWDPFSTLGGPHGHGDEDPTGTIMDGFIVVGVPLGTTPDGTLGTFTVAVQLNLPGWQWTFAATDMSGSGTGTIAALLPGPSWNDIAIFEPDSSNVFGANVSGGGWNVYSQPAPVTGDQIMLTLYKPTNAADPLQRFTIQATIGGQYGTGYAGGTPLMPIPFYKEAVFYAACNPYQFVFQLKADSGHDTSSSADSFLASSLSVPAEAAAVATDITDITPSIGGDPTTVTTLGAHNLVPGQQIWIRDVTGPASDANGMWWVYATPAADQLQLMEDDIPPPVIFSGGTGYVTGTSLGTVSVGVFNATLVTTLSNGQFQNTPNGIYVNGAVKQSWSAISPRVVIPMAMPLLNAGMFNSDQPTNATSLKALLQASYVSLTITDNHESRVCGLLWDSFVQLKIQPLQVQAVFPGTTLDSMNFLAQSGTFKNVAASLWFVTKEN